MAAEPGAIREVSIPVAPGRVALAMAAIILVLTTLSVSTHIASLRAPGSRLARALPSLSLNAEANLPTWYASSSLLFCAALLALHARMRRAAGAPYARHFAFLAFVFVLLSLDETAQFHESLSRPVRSVLRVGGVWYFAWIIPGAAFVAAMALGYLRFLIALPGRTRLLFLVAAALFVGGAIGAEMLGGWIYQQTGFGSAAYFLVTTAEEALEMAGVAVFAYALLDAMPAGVPRRG